MVCKENVVSWFGNLSSYKRIDVMCTLLNMCLPFEVRYLGTCVEDLGKRDYNDLRDTEHRANNASDLMELTALGVMDKRTRRKLSLYMALLHSCNYACAVILYKNLSNVDFQEIVNLLNRTTFSQDDQTLEELLLLYTMALNHPAFTYEQKSVFGNIYAKLQEEETRFNPPKSSTNSSFKSAQGCTPCATPNDRVADSEIPNCLIPPPAMQPFHGDISARNNPIVTGIPPGLTMPPPGLCLPPPDQISVGSSAAAQYLHLGFPSLNHMPPWSGQVMMSNPVLYPTADVLAYPTSPLVSHQSSPSQSRSPSRSNSPMSNRRNNTNPRTSSSQVTQSVSSTLTTATSTICGQTSISSSITAVTAPVVAPLQILGSTSATGSTKSQPSLPNQSLLPPTQWSIPPPMSATATPLTGNSWHSNTEGCSMAQASVPVSKQTPPPPRLRSTGSVDSLSETLGKEMPSFKNNLQNLSIDEIRRMGDEELRDLGLPSNAVGQLRSIVKGQTSNGLNLLMTEKKLECPSNVVPHPVLEHVDNEAVKGSEVLSEASNTGTKCIPLQQQQQVLHHHHNHAAANVRRYPTIPPMDPSQMQMYPHPPPVYAAQNTPCYACLTMPVSGIQNRYQRCNAQQVYCLTQLQTLRLDPESSRHCSQSSSSESTGSRSPPETPPAAPWVGGGESSATNQMSDVHASSGVTPQPTIPGSSAYQAAAQSLMHAAPEKQQRNSRKNPTHYVRHKNQMVNGGPPSLSQCVAFPPQPSHAPITYLQHGHFPSLRPAAGIYSNFSQTTYARPTYPTYQPNGEMIYQYPGAHSAHHPGSGGTPPPSTAPVPSQTPYLPPTPVVTYSTAVPPPKLSCYNCGSSSHHAADCKDQTMEDLTKGAQYRLDYTILKHPGDCPGSDK